MSKETLPIGTVDPEQVRQAKAAAAAQDLAAIEARIVGPAPGQGDYESVCENLEQAEADRAVLFAEVQRLRGLLGRVAAKAWSGPGFDRHSEMRIAGFGFVRPRYRSDDAFHDECIYCEAEPDKGEIHLKDCPAEELAAFLPAGTLASLPADECDGGDR